MNGRPPPVKVDHEDGTFYVDAWDWDFMSNAERKRHIEHLSHMQREGIILPLHVTHSPEFIKSLYATVYYQYGDPAYVRHGDRTHRSFQIEKALWKGMTKSQRDAYVHRMIAQECGATYNDPMLLPPEDYR